MSKHEFAASRSPVALITEAAEQAHDSCQARAYRTPELHEVGSLKKLQHYGKNYHDGLRYKDSY
jgi:hypothetical protein